jgi:hypothetical protein
VQITEFTCAQANPNKERPGHAPLAATDNLHWRNIRRRPGRDETVIVIIAPFAVIAPVVRTVVPVSPIRTLRGVIPTAMPGANPRDHANSRICGAGRVFGGLAMVD